MSSVSIPLSEIARALTPLSWDILDMLQSTEYITYTMLKDRLDLRSHDKASKEIARLEGALLITVNRDQRDQRKVTISMTRYGFEILKERSN